MPLSWRTSVPRPGAPARRTAQGISLCLPGIEELETRLLPSGTPTAALYTPAQTRHGYGFDQTYLPDGTLATGAGQTVALFEQQPLNAAALLQSLHDYDQLYGLPGSNVQFVGLYGPPDTTTAGPSQGEADIDILQVNTYAPGANIVIVEGPNTYQAYADFARYMVSAGIAVGSASYGLAELPFEQQFDAAFNMPNATVFFSASDTGSNGGYPPMSPYIVSVGGTSLYLDPAGNYLGETAWSNTPPAVYTGAGGISQFEPQPAYQNGVVTQTTQFRTNPDIAFDADGQTSQAAGFGTSVASPMAAAMMALVNQGRAQLGLAPLGAYQALSAFYGAPASAYHDVISGFNGQYSAGPGYDLTTGRGSPIVNLLVPYMVGWGAPRPTASPASYRLPPGTSSSVAAAAGLGQYAQSNLPGFPGLTFQVVQGPQHGSLTLNADGSFTYAPAAGFSGIDTFTYQASSYAGSSAPATVTLDVAPVYTAVGADAGGGPTVQVFDAPAGTLLASFNAFAPGFSGGVRVAVGDVNGDGIPDIIAAAGPGGGPQVTVFDGRTFQALRSLYAFAPSFTGGVTVASGDVNGDGFADVICGAGSGGGPQVAVYSGKDGTLLTSFYAFSPGFTGGVRVGAGDTNGDGFADVVTGAGPGGGPQVAVYSGKDGSLLASFFAFAASFKGGVFVAAGDVNGDRSADIIAGAGPGGGPQVAVYDGRSQTLLASFFAFSSGFTGGVRVGYTPPAGPGGRAAILAGAGPGGGPQVVAFDAATLQALNSFFAYNPTFTNGIFVGGG